MAEPDSILQLGIEAARDGNKEEARNLFRLLTRQEPNNAQAWLWLAGVAENREERQAALEQVVALEPNNEMGIKGLQALGVRPGSTPAPVPPPEPVRPAPARAPVDDDPFGDDDPFAELDALSETMAADESGPVRRSEPVQPREDATVVTSTRSTSTYPSSNRSTSSSSSRSTTRYDDDDDGTVPARRGFSPLALLLLLVGAVMVVLLLLFWWNGRGDNVASNVQQTQLAQTNQAVASTSVLPVDVTPTSAASQPTADTLQPTAVAPPLEQPTVAPPPSTNDPNQQSPAIVQPNTPLSSQGWLYDFNQPTYAAPIIGNLGQYSPNNGRFAIILLFAVNQTGTAQAIPPDFFVLKDAQGRVWQARPEVSDAYVVPGVNADLSHSQPLPTDGLTRSIALIFDVAPDATDLVFFAPSNPSQGWLVLGRV